MGSTRGAAPDVLEGCAPEEVPEPEAPEPDGDTPDVEDPLPPFETGAGVVPVAITWNEAPVAYMLEWFNGFTNST